MSTTEVAKHPCASTNDPCDWELIYCELHRKTRNLRQKNEKLLEALRHIASNLHPKYCTTNDIHESLLIAEAAIRKAKGE